MFNWKLKRYSNISLNTDKMFTQTKFEELTGKRVTLCDVKDYLDNLITVDNIMDGFSYFDDGEHYMTDLQERKVRDKFIEIINDIREGVFLDYKLHKHENNYQTKEELEEFGLMREEEDEDFYLSLYCEAEIDKEDGSIEVGWIDYTSELDGRYINNNYADDYKTQYVSMI